MSAVIEKLAEKRAVPTWAVVVLAFLAGGWLSVLAAWAMRLPQ